MKEALYVPLGRKDYGETWALQQKLCEARRINQIPDVLLLVEHPPVITLGRRQKAADNILIPRFPIFEVERGGDVTYHGPGQLVGYPILLLEEGERDLHRYLRNLEEGLIQLCQECGIHASRKEGYTGVWTLGKDPGTAPRKLASIGIAVRRWVTFHGFALNVTTDLSHFAALHPCGLEAEVMTSLANEGARIPEQEELESLCVKTLGTALGRSFHKRTGNVAPI